MSVLEEDQIQASDSIIKRNRLGRLAFFIFSFLAATVGQGLLLGMILGDWFNLFPLGFVIGLSGGLVLFFLFLYDRMIIQVESQRAFVTLNLLKTFFKGDKVYVAYGPGFHLSYPWEQRLARNNVSLVEATENFSVSVVTKTGIVKIKGSYRIRPRLGTESLVAFLGGVAVIAEDVADLIKSVITEILAEETLEDVSKKLKDINAELAARFGNGNGTADPKISDFEGRFGLVIGDVTAAEVELSAEAMKTRNAIDEGVQFAQGVAIILGFKTSEELQAAINDGKMSQEVAENARKQFLAISDNAKMDIKDYTINVRGLEGLDSRTAQSLGGAVTAVAQNSRGGGNRK